MNLEELKKYKVGDAIEWFETREDGTRTGFHMGYFITRINYKRGLVWGKRCNALLWEKGGIQLNLKQLGKE